MDALRHNPLSDIAGSLQGAAYCLTKIAYMKKVT